MKVYVSKNRIKRLKTFSNNNYGIEIIKGIRWTLENDAEFKENYEKMRKDGNYEKERTERSIRRTRKDIQDILNANLDDNSYFVTLTFKENIQDYKKAYQKFKYFINIKNKDIKYLCVKEHQERGAIHYHLIVFDIEKEKLKSLVESWTYGIIKHYKKITDFYTYKIADYFVKYLSKKNQRVKAGYRIFTTSTNLKKPLIISDKVVNKILEKYKMDVDLECYNWLQHNYIIEHKPKYDVAVDFVKFP